MSALNTLVDSILADPLAAAKAAPRAIGYVGMDIPEDVLAAGDFHSCHLPWDADRETPRADQWLESSFAPWTRSIIEDWADGRFDFMEAVIFTRGEDSAQRLYYYICELQRRGEIAGPTPLIFDVARIGRQSSIDRTADGVRRLVGQLGLSNEDLSRGIATANKRRVAFQGVETRRSGNGPLYERIARASLFAPLDHTLEQVEASEGRPLGRILLTGNAPPDERLHAAVEATGWSIVGEAHDRSLLRLGAAVSESGDPAAAIATQVHQQIAGSRSFANHATWIVDEARRLKADAALIWLIEQEEALVWHAPPQEKALAEAGIPCLSLSRRRWDAADGAAEEITAFIRGLGK